MDRIKLEFSKTETVSDEFIKGIIEKFRLRNVSPESVLTIEVIELSQRNYYIKIIKQNKIQGIYVDEVYASLHDNDFCSHIFSETSVCTNVIFAQMQQEILQRIKHEKYFNVEECSKNNGVRYLSKRNLDNLKFQLTGGKI